MPTTIPTDALTTRAKVKSFLGITASDNDALIDELITYVTAYAKSYCGRNFLAAALVEAYDTYEGRKKLFLRQRPVNSITSVEYRSGTPSSPVWNTYNADSYLKYLDEGYIHFYGLLPEVHQGLRVTYNAGYLIDFTQEFDTAHHTLPEDLTLAVTEIIAGILNTRKASGVTNEATEGQSITYAIGKLSENTKATLDKYKFIRIAR